MELFSDRLNEILETFVGRSEVSVDSADNLHALVVGVFQQLVKCPMDHEGVQGSNLRIH